MLEILSLMEKIVKQIHELFGLFAPGRKATLDEIEAKVFSLMLEIGRLLVASIIRSRGTGFIGKKIQTPLGDTARYHGVRKRSIETLMGTVEIDRAYYYTGKGGYVPLDESLSLPQEGYSYAVQEAMSLFAIEDSYSESAKKLCHLFPVKVSESTVRRISQKYGRQIAAQESAKVEAIFSHSQPVPEPEIESVEHGYVGVDGVMVPTVEGYREMKVAATYDTPSARDALANNLYYHALFEVPDVFGEHVWVMLKQRGIYDAQDSSWVCDGAKWIWRQKELHDPESRETVDLIHASEYLSEVANAIYGHETDNSRECFRCMRINLRKSGGKEVLTALCQLQKQHPAAYLSEAITYFQNNAIRMDYPTYEAEGYHITSSTVESACRHVVGDRLKRSGMRWTQEGAQSVISLRLKWKNGKWNDFWMDYRPAMAVA